MLWLLPVNVIMVMSAALPALPLVTAGAAGAVPAARPASFQTIEAPARATAFTPTARTTHIADFDLAAARSPRDPFDIDARYAGGSLNLRFTPPRQGTPSATVRALRFDKGRRNGSPLDTKLTLKLTGDAHSLNSSLGLTGIGGAVTRMLGN